jgi:hypothetical protein
VHEVKTLVNISGLIEMKAHYGGGVLGVVVPVALIVMIDRKTGLSAETSCTML